MAIPRNLANIAPHVNASSTELVVNDGGANLDFRVEGDTNANLLVADAGAEKVGFGTNTFNTNGGVIQVSNGISFPATQSASSDANTLDDYEEGSWTPTYRGSVSDPTVTYSTTRSGQYTKIGNMVFCRGDLRTDAFTGGSGDVRIGDLPFTTTNSPSNAGFGFVSVYSGDGASFAGDVPISGQSINNSTQALLQYRTSANGSWSALQMADLADGSSKNFIKFVIYYQV